MLAAASGAEVISVDLIPERLELARYAGATHVLMGGKDAAEEIRDLTDGRGTEVGMDCSGSAAGRKLCLEAAREWGRIVCIGEGGSVTFEPSPLLLHKQLTLHGSWVCGINEMGSLLEHLERKGTAPRLDRHPHVLALRHQTGLRDLRRRQNRQGRDPLGRRMIRTYRTEAGTTRSGSTGEP